MSAGKRYKFSGSTIQILTAFAGESPTHAITGITNANPAVVTSAYAANLADGDVIEITGVVGMTELNSGVFIVNVVDSTHFQLLDTNSSGYGTWTSGGSIQTGTFSTFCELTDYNRQGGASPEISATSVCSTAAEYEIGLPDFGTTQLSFNFAPQTTVQGALHTWYLSGDTMAIRITLPNSGGTLVQLGHVQQESEKAGNGTLWTAQTTIRNTGNRADFA